MAWIYSWRNPALTTQFHRSENARGALLRAKESRVLREKRLNFKTFISFRTIGVIASGERGQRMLSPRERVIVMKVGQLALDNRVRFKYSSLFCSQPPATSSIH